MNLINKWIRFKAKSFLNVLGCLIIFIFLLFSVSSCEKDNTLKSTKFSSYVIPGTFHDLLHFGLDLNSNYVDDGFVLTNLYATKVVVLDILEFDEIVSSSELKTLIDSSIGVDATPKIDMGSDYISITYCLGILINEDYYLLLIDYIEPTYITDHQNNLTFIAQVSGKYKH